MIIFYFATSLVTMYNYQQDSLRQSTMQNPFDDQTRDYNMTNSRIMPNFIFGLLSEDQAYFDELVELVTPTFFDVDVEVIRNNL